MFSNPGVLRNAFDSKKAAFLVSPLSSSITRTENWWSVICESLNIKDLLEEVTMLVVDLLNVFGR